jgi:hypothetical protein
MGSSNPKPLKAGDPIFRESLDTEPHENVNFLFPIALNEPQIAPIQSLSKLLQKMTDAVGGLVPHFAGFV